MTETGTDGAGQGSDDVWDRRGFVDGTARHWRIRGLDLFVLRRDDSWFVQSTLRAPAPEEVPESILGAEIDWVPDNSDADVVRHLVPGSEPELELALGHALPDRPVVSRPREPFVLPPEQRTTLYVGVAAWITLRVSALSTPLLELPTAQLQRTWFGPSTLQGALCYALRTRCLTRPDGMHPVPWRVAVPLRLHNRGRDGWALDRVALPVDLLPVFRGEDGGLWSSDLSVVRHQSGEVGDVSVGRTPPDESGTDARPVAAPRRDADSSLLGRFYGSLF